MGIIEETSRPGAIAGAREARRAYQREWRRQHPEKIREYKKRWYKTHADQQRIYNARYWAKRILNSAQDTD